jgi:hypothetical protein
LYGRQEGKDLASTLLVMILPSVAMCWAACARTKNRIGKQKGLLMFTKLKQELRSIVADEVGRVGADLRRERAALQSQLEAFNAVTQRLREVSQCGDEVMRLRETFQVMNAAIAGINDCVKKLHRSRDQ